MTRGRKPKQQETEPVYEETLEQQEAEREFMRRLDIFESFRADQENSDE